MLRSLLIYLSQANWMRRRVMGWKIARKVALRFVAGESLEDAIGVVKTLNQQNITYRILAKEKPLNSIWEKMKIREIPFEEVFDAFSVQIVIDAKGQQEKIDCTVDKA